MILRKIIANFFSLSPLFFHVQLLNIFMYYLNYIMNFSKANVRDLAKAKYEDTYLLTTFKLYHLF